MRDYTTDSRVREMLDQYDWYIMPVMNPDGYVYSFSGAVSRVSHRLTDQFLPQFVDVDN